MPDWRYNALNIEIEIRNFRGNKEKAISRRRKMKFIKLFVDLYLHIFDIAVLFNYSINFPFQVSSII